MKKLKIFLLAVLFVFFGVSAASAKGVLYDWYVDVNGAIYEVYPSTYIAPSVGGDITGVGGFSLSDPGYGFDVPDAVGSVQVYLNPGSSGSYYVAGYFDIEINSWWNGWNNESGAVIGSAPLDGFGSIEHPQGDPGDIAWYFEWDFNLADDEYALVSFNISNVMPTSAYYLLQSDLDVTGQPIETFYLTSTLAIESGGGPQEAVPEPATMFLLGSGLVGLFGLGRKRFKK